MDLNNILMMIVLIIIIIFTLFVLYRFMVGFIHQSNIQRYIDNNRWYRPKSHRRPRPGPKPMPPPTPPSPRPGPYPPFEDKRYMCFSGECIEDEAGNFRTLSGCRLRCGQKTKKATCIGGLCMYAIDGEYKTMKECEEDCGSEVPTITKRWKCKMKKGRGWCMASADGEYRSWEDCTENCASKTNKKGWKCTDEKECKYERGGTFKSKEKCKKHCGIRWNCQKREGRGWCVASANGKYNNWEDCSENCASKMDKKGWRCTREQECKYQRGGTFKTKGECEKTCGLKYKCKDGKCVKDKKGKFTSMAECVNMCGTTKKN